MGWSLVVLAAGKGSRFGGPKQLAPVGPHDEPLLALTLQDAIAAGCTRCVVVTRPEHQEQLSSVLSNQSTSVDFVFQDQTDLPKPVEVCRGKPWGTAHAVWSARAAIHEPFVVVNADDFYGRDSLRKAGQAATQLTQGRAHLVAYRLENTLSDSGGVSRATCELKGDALVGLHETHNIRREDAGIFGQREGSDFRLLPETLVSINLWSLPHAAFSMLEEEFLDFLDKADLERDEFGLPQTIGSLIKTGRLQVTVSISGDRWMGMTYAEDLPEMRRLLTRLVES
jgi:dTDP-glucose pyrophosphorylase